MAMKSAAVAFPPTPVIPPKYGSCQIEMIELDPFTPAAVKPARNVLNDASSVAWAVALKSGGPAGVPEPAWYPDAHPAPTSRAARSLGSLVVARNSRPAAIACPLLFCQWVIA
jgi:hypothetical protein